MPLNLDQRFTHEQVREYEDGEVVFEENEDSRDLYIIQEGSVVIQKTTELGQLQLAQFHRGDFFGDMALLQGKPRYAAAVAKGRTRLLILQPGGFLLKIRRDPTFAFEMLQQLSYRVQVSNDRLIEALAAGKMPKDSVEQILQIPEGRDR